MIERNFIRTEKLDIFFLKFKNYIDLKQFINNNGIYELLYLNNNSSIAVYIEQPNIKSKYLINEFLLTELNKEEYNHLYNKCKNQS